MAYYFWVLDTPAGPPVVVDCGLRVDEGARRGRVCSIEPAAALTRLGIDPASVKQVVLTHLQYDHIGNVDLFPSALLVIARRELDSGLRCSRRARTSPSTQTPERSPSWRGPLLRRRAGDHDRRDQGSARAVGRSTENKTVTLHLLADLVDRGLDCEQGVLVVLARSKALRAAVSEVFGPVLGAALRAPQGMS